MVAGVAGGVLAAAGGTIALRMSRSEADYRAIAGDGSPPLVLNWKGPAVMSLVANRIIAPTADMPSVQETMTARRIDLELSYGSAKLQSDMKASLGYLEILPALSGDVRPFSTLPADEQTDTLRSMSASAGADRAIYMALKFFSGLFYYTDDRSWPSIDYVGPSVPEKVFEGGNRIANLALNQEVVQ